VISFSLFLLPFYIPSSLPIIYGGCWEICGRDIEIPENAAVRGLISLFRRRQNSVIEFALYQCYADRACNIRRVWLLYPRQM